MPHLRVLKGAKQGEQYPLTKAVTVIGRNPDCDIWVNLGAVSREHAEILQIDGRYFVKDLGSRNKTYVNDKEVDPKSPTLLQVQDRIRICDFVCTFEDPSIVPPVAHDVDDSGTIMSSVMVRNSNALDSQPAERLRALLEITNRLSSTLEVESLIPMILDQLMSVFRVADRSFFVIRVDDKFIPKAIKTRRERDEATARFSKTIMNKCLDEARAILSEDALQDEAFAMSASVTDFRIRSVMCAPLLTNTGESLGVIQIDTQDRMRKFTQDDLQFLIAVCNQFALSMMNAHLHEEQLNNLKFQQEIELAKEVQKTFLPSRVPVIEDYEFFAFYKAAREVGGDYFGFIQLPNDRLAIAIGDVAGKGIPAALLMARLSGDVRYSLLAEDDPAKATQRLNDRLQEAGMVDRFITFCLVVLDHAHHQVTIVNAGHVPPLLRLAQGAIVELAAGDLNGLPLGVMEGYEYQAVQYQMNPGDQILLCTDGITDATNQDKQVFGMERLKSRLTEWQIGQSPLGKYILDQVDQHADQAEQFDDITMVTIGRNP